MKKLAEEYESLVGENGLDIVNFGITWRRIIDGKIKESSLDHLITNNPNTIANHKTVDVGFSDHSAIVADIAIVKQKVKKQKRVSRDMRKIRSNPERFLFELAKIDWAQITEISTDKPFNCHVCEKNFGDLRQHESIHTKDNSVNTLLHLDSALFLKFSD